MPRAGYRTFVAHDGQAALELATKQRPDDIILDLMLPGLSGTDVAARVRAEPALANTIILMLTARAEEVDQLVGLAVGADDYMTKPFSVKVLIAKVQALLRRPPARATESAARLRLGAVEVNTDTHEAGCAGQPVKLTLTEFRIAAALIQAGGRVLSRNELVSKAIGPGI